MLGYADDELPNSIESWERVIFNEDRREALKLVEDFKAGRVAEYRAVQRFRHKAHSVRHILSRAIGERDENGETDPTGRRAYRHYRTAPGPGHAGTQSAPDGTGRLGAGIVHQRGRGGAHLRYAPRPPVGIDGKRIRIHQRGADRFRGQALSAYDGGHQHRLGRGKPSLLRRAGLAGHGVRQPRYVVRPGHDRRRDGDFQRSGARSACGRHPVRPSGAQGVPGTAVPGRRPDGRHGRHRQPQGAATIRPSPTGSPRC